MRKTVAVFGTMDTKGEDYFYLKECLERCGVGTLLIDTGIRSDPRWPCEVSAETVAKAGGSTLKELKDHDRLYVFQIMGNGSAKLIRRLCEDEKIQGAISMGGGQGTLLAAMAMRELPIGFPKMIVSTIANLRTPPFEGVKDTVVMNSLVDISGLNHILRQELENAAAAMAGMVLFGKNNGKEVGNDSRQVDQGASAGCSRRKKTVAMTMFGVTTPCVDHVRELLEKKDYEVLIFHANGQGGRMMEAMIKDGFIDGVADVTTGELTQELLGGNCSAGPHRLEAAPEAGIPQVIVPGAMELANFMPPSALPLKYSGRSYYMHNPNLLLLRANAEESREAGRILAEKLNHSKGAVTVLLPLKGISLYDRPGGPLEDPEADAALFAAIRERLRSDIRVKEYSLHINDREFAEAVAAELEEALAATEKRIN